MTKATLLFAAVIGLAACGGADGVTSEETPGPPPAEPPAASVTIDPPRGFDGMYKLDLGEQTGLTATVRDSLGTVLPNHVVTWTSSAPGVASVSSTGTIIGVAAGDAMISATSDGKYDTR